MKLTAILLLSTCLQLSAKSYSQTITLSLKNAPLEKVLSLIEKQTGYTFFYKIEHIQKAVKVDVNVRNGNLEQVLQVIFRNQPLSYDIIDKNIVLKEKPQQPGNITVAGEWAGNIEGRIVDSSGDGIAGAVISIKGTDLKTVSGNDGRFVLKNVPGGAILVVESMGYRTIEVSTAGKQSVLVRLIPEAAQLTEMTVVSTGYQRIKKFQMTGSVSTLSEKEYDQRVAVTGNFLESLEGKIPGLVYNGQTGELSIRGIATFDAVKQPLIIVDGFPTEINLLTINPNDIVSVSVLKDAAATAIYGVRASNGVIVLETRRGKSGKPVLNVRASAAVQSKPDFGYLKYAPASEYAQLEASMITAANQFSLLNLYNSSLGYPLSPVQTIMLNKYLGNITETQAKDQLAAVGDYDNLAEYERLFYQSRQVGNMNVDVSGGSDRGSYMLGFNYIGERPVNRRSENRQYILNTANTYRFNNRMKFDFKGTYTSSTNTSGLTPAYSSFYPYEHLADDAGNPLPVSMGTLSFSSRQNSLNTANAANNNANMALGLYDQLYYPYRELSSNTNTTRSSSIRFQGRLNVRLTEWLNMDLGGNYEYQDVRLDNLAKEDAYNTRLLLNLSAAKDVAGKASYVNVPQGDILKRTSQRVNNYSLRGQLNFDRSFGNGDHVFSGILGIEQRKTVTDQFTTTFFGYDGQTLVTKPVNMLALNNLGSSNASFPNVKSIIIYNSNAASWFGQTYKDSRFMSYYGNATYIFRNRYIATGSMRLDQSNLFGSDPKYRNKPLWSAGLAWRLTGENFLKGEHWLNDLKLRTAMGFTGNIPSSNNGKFLLLTAGATTLFPTSQTYYSVSSPQNESLRWETTKNYNVGLDYALLDNRISGAIDYYVKRSVDVFGTVDADPTSGFNAYNANTASILNKGIEITVSSANVKSRNLQWVTTVTASFNHNEITAVKAPSYSNSTSYVSGLQNIVGKPIGALLSYNYGGLTALGQPYVIDSKGNQKIISIPSIDVSPDDLIYNGTTTPKYSLGLNNQLSFGSIDLSFLFMYYGGHVMRVEAPSPNSIFNPNPIEGSSNYWTKPGDELTTLIPALPKGSSSAVGYYSAFASYGYFYASRFVRKADYIRLRDLVVTWNIRGKAIPKLGIVQPQLRLQAQNVWRYTFSGNDIDPEAISRVSGYRTLPQQPFYSISFYGKF